MEKKKLDYPPKCPDCDEVIKIRDDTERGEIYSCPGCGLELEVKRIGYDNKKRINEVDLQELTIEGEDWGE